MQADQEEQQENVGGNNIQMSALSFGFVRFLCSTKSRDKTETAFCTNLHKFKHDLFYIRQGRKKNPLTLFAAYFYSCRMQSRMFICNHGDDYFLVLVDPEVWGVGGVLK